MKTQKCQTDMEVTDWNLQMPIKVDCGSSTFSVNPELNADRELSFDNHRLLPAIVQINSELYDKPQQNSNEIGDIQIELQQYYSDGSPYSFDEVANFSTKVL